MSAPRTEEDEAHIPTTIGQGIVFEKDKVWWAFWRDHANRLIKFRLGTVAAGMDERQAQIEAFENVERYRADIDVRNQVRDMLNVRQVKELADRAVFPREVVAMFIDQLCRRIAREEAIEAEGDTTPAIHIFVDRTRNVDGRGISAREVNRILKEEDRITVSQKVVDTICCEFNLHMDDVVKSALNWSQKFGEWEDRIGSPDPWPYGYLLSKDDEKDDLL